MAGKPEPSTDDRMRSLCGSPIALLACPADGSQRVAHVKQRETACFNVFDAEAGEILVTRSPMGWDWNWLRSGCSVQKERNCG